MKKEKLKEDVQGGGATTPSWHAMSVEEVESNLGLSTSVIKEGLMSAEATERLEKFGLNKMTDAVKKTLCQRIYDQVANVGVHSRRRRSCLRHSRSNIC